MTTKQVIYLPILSSILFSNNELDSISARELKILSNNFHCPIIFWDIRKRKEYQNSRDSRNEEENSTRRSLKTKRNGGKSFVVVTRRVVTSRRKLKRSEERRRNEKKTKLRSGEIKNFAVVVQTRHNQPSVFSSSNVSKEHCSLGETIGSSLVDRINIYIYIYSCIGRW